MKKQLSKIITLALILSISTILVSANYSSTSQIAIFEVEFDFQIGDSTFSKGRYRLSKDRQVVLYLENLEGSETKVLLGRSGSLSSNDRESSLVFNRYGDQYFLRKISSPTISAKLKISEDEKTARRNSQKKLAKVKVVNGK